MASPPILDDPNHSARRAKTRIAVAVVLLAIAIGGLTLLDSQQPDTNPGSAAAQKQENISSNEKAAPVGESPPTQITSQEKEAPPPAETPATPLPPPPQVLPPQPLKNTPPPHAKSVGNNSPVPSEPITPEPKSPEAVPSANKNTAEQATQKPTSQPVKPAPAPATKSGPAPKIFDVQVGVFTDMDNAKQLQTRLAEQGIPSHTETKLQVGPFNTKAEADAAREKLKNMGIGSVVVPGK